MINLKGLSGNKWMIVLAAVLVMTLLNMNHTVHGAIINIDTQVAFKMNSILGTNPFLDETLAWLSTSIGDAFVFTCVSLLFFVHALNGGSHAKTIKRLSYWIWLGLLCLIVYMFASAAEYLIKRDTPISSLHHFYNLQTHYGIMFHSCPTSSFPSGHGLAYIFFAMMAWQRYFRISLILWCLAFIMLSVRLIVGLHWLSDIMIGSLFLSTLLGTLVGDTSLKNTYQFCEKAVSHVFGRLSDWRDRCCEIIIQQGNHRRIS